MAQVKPINPRENIFDFNFYFSFAFNAKSINNVCFVDKSLQQTFDFRQVKNESCEHSIVLEMRGELRFDINQSQVELGTQLGREEKPLMGKSFMR